MSAGCFFASCGAFACVALLAARWLPQPYPDRLAVIQETSTTINNVQPYDSTEKWAANGSQAGLHLLNPARVKHFDETIRSLVKPPFQVLDVGCGGGLVSNALGELSGYAEIQGVDLSSEALLYARGEAHRRNLSQVSYQNASVYQLPFGSSSFNVVIMSDVLEHFLDVVGALKEVARILKPGGILVFDTITRSPVSFFVAILGAEYVVRLIDKGSHDWRLFIRPEELQSALQLAGFQNSKYDAFDASFRALAELSFFSWGLLQAENMQAGWKIGAPSSMMVSYIGHASRV